MRVWPRSFALIFCIASCVIGGPAVHVQTPGAAASAAFAGVAPEHGDRAAALINAPSPDPVDAMLATLTDAQARALLRDEMRRRAADRAAATASAAAVEGYGRRLDAMLATIGLRLAQWRDEIADLDLGAVDVSERLTAGGAGPAGVMAALAAIIAAGAGAAWSTARMTARWRRETARLAGGDYWTRLLQTASLTVIDLAPALAFSVATILAGRLLQGPLGPLTDHVWVYQDAVVSGWVFLVLMQRAFAPDAARLRLAAVDDRSADAVVRLGRRVIIVAVAGWLTAGLAPPLGLGVAPMMGVVAATGVAVTAMLIVAVLRNGPAIRSTVLSVLTRSVVEGPAPWQRIVAAAAPSAALIYVVFAGGYALLHWLESGDLRLLGPASTGLVLMLAPLADRFGREAARGLTRRETPRALRYRGAIVRVWRVFLAGAGIAAITRLWGFNFFDLAHAPGAPAWRAGALNVVWAIVLAWAGWQSVRAGLWSAARAAGGDEDEAGDAAAASRLDTLTPLFRIALGVVTVLALLTYALAQADLDVGPLLASAGILGIALGFGAQALVRDVLSGIFFLTDDAFRVGEYIEIEGDIRGEVEAISLRSLQLRHDLGAVLTIPFGELKSVANHNRDWVICKMNFRLEPDTDPKAVKKLVKAVGQEFMVHPEHGPKFIEPLKSQGVHMIDDDSALVFRVKFKCKPRQHFVLRREIYHRLREVFAENGVGLARRKVEVVSSGGDAPAHGLPEEVFDDRQSPRPA